MFWIFYITAFMLSFWFLGPRIAEFASDMRWKFDTWWYRNYEPSDEEQETLDLIQEHN